MSRCFQRLFPAFLIATLVFAPGYRPDAPDRPRESRLETPAVPGATFDSATREAGADQAWWQAASTQLAVPNWTVDGDQGTAQFGYSVATAGDVNGDGYMDVIVGAPGYDDPGSMDWGRAYVFHGSAFGLSTNADWIVQGDQAGAEFGHSVATAGDVNGDGYSDVIIGSWRHSNVELNEGAAYVYLGSSTGLATTAAWSAEGNQFNAQFGVSVAPAGDVNGDGYGDVIVGADFYTNGEFDEGRAYAYHGSASGLSTTPAWTVEPNFPGFHLGNSVATAGDVNADGYSDVIVGASLASGGQGQAFVYHGSASGLSTTASWSGTGAQPGSGYGTSVATAGDVNGDGYSDIIVGSPNEISFSTGRAYVYLGSPVGVGGSAIWNGGSAAVSQRFGYSVATAGDVNADGYADVIVGCDDSAASGQAMVFHGSAVGPSLYPDVTAGGGHNDDRFGSSVAPAGDINGDGYSDVIVGSYSFDSIYLDGGRAVVLHGGNPGLALTAGWFATSDQDSSWFGRSVASAGDVNGDGYADVIVGAPHYANGQSDEGHAFVFHGSAGGLSATPDWTLESNQSGVLLGQVVASAGDVNGDGYSDVLATSYENNGTVVVYHGSAAGLSTTANWTHEGGIFGTTLFKAASAGDVNGDGYSDVIVGHPSDAHPETGEGRAFVFLGSSTGLATTAAWSAESDQVGAGFGASVGTAGDVNGDGYSDVIVGSGDWSNGELNEGGAWVFLGSASGLAPTAAWAVESNEAFAEFGASVGTAGDVNGDGYSDVIVGRPSTVVVAVPHEGAAFVYLGSAAGLSPTHAWMVTGSTPFDFLGTSVATAGDVNGDGYSDVVVGSPEYVAPHALVYHGSPTGLSVAPAWSGNAGQTGSSYGHSVAGAGDVNGDGHDDVLVGAYTYSAVLPGDGRAFLYYGNGFPGGGPSRPIGPRQFRTDAVTPIAKLGSSDSSTEFRFAVNLPSAYGRTKLKFEYEVKPFGAPFTGVGTLTSVPLDTGLIGLVVVNHPIIRLAPDTQYHWRVRTWYDYPAGSLFQIHGPWMHQGPNGDNEADFRTAGGGGVVSVTEELGPRTGSRFELLAGGANPARGGAQVLLVLRERSRVQAEVLDVAGRKVAVLTRAEIFDPGSHPLTWDGRTESGAQAATGVYFLRVRAGDEVRVRKAVLLR